MRVFITGASGYIGTAVSAKLRDLGHQVMGLMADALTLDQSISSRKAMQELGWTPQAESVLEELSN